ncbi:MAG: hypothetical protein DRN20_06210 [Thermoplasmata archaeon]|nr:MAG: hypothetical protein DRN20_06210 [Thermoplasmata archaeon]
MTQEYSMGRHIGRGVIFAMIMLLITAKIIIDNIAMGFPSTRFTVIFVQSMSISTALGLIIIVGVIPEVEKGLYEAAYSQARIPRTRYDARRDEIISLTYRTRPLPLDHPSIRHTYFVRSTLAKPAPS